MKLLCLNCYEGECFMIEMRSKACEMYVRSGERITLCQYIVCGSGFEQRMGT